MSLQISAGSPINNTSATEDGMPFNKGQSAGAASTISADTAGGRIGTTAALDTRSKAICVIADSIAPVVGSPILTAVSTAVGQTATANAPSAAIPIPRGRRAATVGATTTPVTAATTGMPHNLAAHSTKSQDNGAATAVGKSRWADAATRTAATVTGARPALVHGVARKVGKDLRSMMVILGVGWVHMLAGESCVAVRAVGNGRAEF